MHWLTNITGIAAWLFGVSSFVGWIITYLEVEAAIETGAEIGIEALGLWTGIPIAAGAMLFGFVCFWIGSRLKVASTQNKLAKAQLKLAEAQLRSKD